MRCYWVWAFGRAEARVARGFYGTPEGVPFRFVAGDERCCAARQELNLRFFAQLRSG
jgi:hypothetical protein